MHDSCKRPPSSREAGKAFLIAAILASVAVCGIAACLAFFLFRHPEGGPAVRPAPQTQVEENKEGEASEPAAGAPVSAPGVASKTDAEPSAPPEVGAKGAELRIHGTVRDRQEAPLPEILLRWLPLKKGKLKHRSHDIAVLGKDADPALLTSSSDADLRNALTRSLTTSSDAAGAYELRVPLTQEAGVVVASGPGYEILVHTVRLPGAGGAEIEEVPPMDDAAAAPGVEKALQEATVDFVLGPAGSISGALTDKLTGEPVPGMAVVAGTVDRESPAMFSMIAVDAPSTVARADGTYRIDGLPPGEYRVVPRTGSSGYPASPSSLARKIALEAGAEVSGVDFQVSPGGLVRGEVAGPDGKPFQGAQCNLMPTDLMQASIQGEMEWIASLADQKVVTDAEGRFEIRAIPLGQSYRVFISAQGYAPAHSESLEVTEEAPEAEVRVSLSRGSSISGQVTFKDGRPAPGKDVSLQLNFNDLMAGNFGAQGNKVTADEAGNFILKNLAAGDYLLAGGKVKPDNLFTNQRKTAPIKVDGRNDVTGVQVVIEEESESGRVLKGLVVDDLGNPIEGASVRVSAASDFTGAITGAGVDTGADGRFSAPYREGDSLRITASKSGHASVTRQEVDPGSQDLTIALPRHGSISGRVIGPDGQPPPPGGKVKVKPVEGGSILDSFQRIAGMGGQEEPGATLSEDGAFSMGAPPGEAQALAAVPGYAPGRSQPFTVPPGGEVSGVEIRLSVGAALQGRVTLGRNTGVEQATVTIKPSGGDDTRNLFAELMPQAFGNAGNNAVTNEEGYYELQHLAPGTYTISASHTDYAGSDPVTVTLRENSVWKAAPLVLSTGGRISGGVTEQEKPGSGMLVQLMGTGSIKQVITGADGGFEFRGLKAGEYLVNVMDMAAMQKGKMKLKSRAVVLEGEETEELQVVFGVGYKVRGKVRGMPPAPMRMVTLRRPGGPSPEDIDVLDPKASIASAKYQAGIGMVSAEGEYEVEDIEPGEYILEVPRMPADPTDLEAYKTMDRKPHFQKEITVEKKDLELDIEIK